MFPFLGAALAVVLAGCAHFPPQVETPGEYVILYSDLSLEKARRIQEEADRTVRNVCRFLGLNTPSKRTRVFLFGSRRLLRRYMEKESPHHVDVGAACFVTDDGCVVAVAQRWRTAETLRYLRHELTHCVVTAYYDKLPPWINEGLAQFFELGPPYDRAHPALLRTLDGQLRDKREEFLSRLVALPEGVQLKLPEYAQAWGLTHLLLTDSRYGVVWVKDYMAAVNSGADSLEQFRKSFGRTPDEMASSLREHLDKNGICPRL